MNTDKIIILLRVLMGGLFFYAGITKVINPVWSPEKYLLNAQTFSGFYSWLANSTNLPWIAFLNEWGLTLIGACLILGIAVKLSARLGAILMLLYYFPILNFPFVGNNSFLIDEHIIYIAVLCLLANTVVSRKYGLDEILRNILPGSLGKFYKKIS